jgi:hypothetical protein
LRLLAAAALVGVLHVHHAPSHDSDAPFAEVLDAALAAGLDFVVLTEHADPEATDGPLPAAGRAGLYPRPDGGALLVAVGVELGTTDGHLLAYGIDRLVPAEERPARDVIADVHAAGGFAVVPHPFSYGGWRDWDAPFDGLEVHNNAESFRRRVLGPLVPLRLLGIAWDREAALRRMLARPGRALAKWDELLAAGRPVVGLSGADVHRNVSLLGWQLDPYEPLFRAVHTVCPAGPLQARALFAALAAGRCRIRYALFDARADEADEVVFPSGRVELQLDGGARVLELRNPPIIGAP